jgi:hypothetical protein
MNLDNKTESEYVKFVFRYQINSMKKNKRIWMEEFKCLYMII